MSDSKSWLAEIVAVATATDREMVRPTVADEITEDLVTHLHEHTTEDRLAQQTVGDQTIVGLVTHIVNHLGTITATLIHTDQVYPKVTSPSDPTSLPALRICRHHNTFHPGTVTQIGEDAAEMEEGVEGAAAGLGGSHRIPLNAHYSLAPRQKSAKRH